MRAGIITGKRSLELVEFDDFTPTGDRAVIAIELCGICGSDVHAYAEGWRYAASVCGHEIAATVAAVGPDVTGVSEGDRVTVGMAPGCGRCEACVAGHAEYCGPAHKTFMGLGDDASVSGGFAPFMELHARRLSHIPAALTSSQGAMIEPAAVAFHAIRRSRIRPGDVVAVVGAGAIGQLTAQCARVAGAGYVAVVEPDEARRQLAVDLGADVGLAPDEAKAHLKAMTNGLGADVAFDAAGVPQTLHGSTKLLRRGGSVCMVGVAGGAVEVRPAEWLTREISVDTSLAYTHQDFDMVSSLIVDGRIIVEPLHQKTVSLDELPATIDAMADKELTELKIMVDPR